MRVRALGISGVNFCQGIRFWEVNFARALVFAIFDKKMRKRVKKVTYLLKIFNFGALKVMKTCPVIRFLGTFSLGIRFFGEILPGLGFELVAHPYRGEFQH